MYHFTDNKGTDFFFNKDSISYIELAPSMGNNIANLTIFFKGEYKRFMFYIDCNNPVNVKTFKLMGEAE